MYICMHVKAPADGFSRGFPLCHVIILMQDRALSMLDLAGTKALGADIHSLDSAVRLDLDLLNIGIPDTV